MLAIAVVGLLINLAAVAVLHGAERDNLNVKGAMLHEQALETTALMLGSDKSRGYCLEMICADFLAGSATKIRLKCCRLSNGFINWVETKGIAKGQENLR